MLLGSSVFWGFLGGGWGSGFWGGLGGLGFVGALLLLLLLLSFCKVLFCLVFWFFLHYDTQRVCDML